MGHDQIYVVQVKTGHSHWCDEALYTTEQSAKEHMDLWQGVGCEARVVIIQNSFAAPVRSAA